VVSQLNAADKRALVRVILIRGESGAGKNRLAQVIAAHRRWLEIQDKDAYLGFGTGLEPLLDRYGEIHLPSLPDMLAESELFGHKKGAFTGAVKDREGLLKHGKFADILLDEIGDVTPELQAKLLGVVDHGRYRPVGGDWDEEYETSARLILATNRDLERLVRNGRFREDLYWRAMEFVVSVPPLRDQLENIAEIALYIHGVLAQPLRGGLVEPAELTEVDLKWAGTYDWPGNVRHLRHAVKRWLFEGGRRPLSAIVEDLGREMSLARPQPLPPLAALVRERLDSILDGDAPSPGWPGKFVDEFMDQVKAAVHDWYRECQPDEEDLRKLFAEGTIESIRNKISQWGRKNREGAS
jgi:DNA-binding NtrC family response regulator